MQARMKNIAAIFPDALKALFSLNGIAEKGGVPANTLGCLLISIATINVWNRINVATRQVAGSVPV